MSNTVRVWDLPTRLFHWLLVLCVATLFATAMTGGAAMAWHFRAGYMLLALLLFRLLWGIGGGYWSRFARFADAVAVLRAATPAATAREPVAGHTVAGWMSVFAMLLALALQASAGLFSDDEIDTQGPLVALVSGDTVEWATFFHTRVGKWAVLGLALLHLAAIAYYRVVCHVELLKAMLDGDKVPPVVCTPSRDDFRARLVALIVFGLCVLSVLTLLRLA